MPYRRTRNRPYHGRSKAPKVPGYKKILTMPSILFERERRLGKPRQPDDWDCATCQDVHFWCRACKQAASVCKCDDPKIEPCGDCVEIPSRVRA